MKRKGTLIYFLGAFFGVYLSILVVASFLFDERFGYDAEVAGISVAGKTKAQAVEEIERAWPDEGQKIFTIDGMEHPKADLIEKIVIEESIDTALSHQQRGYLTLSFVRPADYLLKIEPNEAKISEIINNLHQKHSKVVTSGQIISRNGGLEVIPGEKGTRLLIPETKKMILEALAELKDSSSFKKVIFEPSISTQTAESLFERAEELVAEPIFIETIRGDYRIPGQTLKSWLGIRPKNPHSVLWRETLIPVEENGEYYYFDESAVTDYVIWLGGKVNQKVSNAVLSFQAEQVIVVTPEKTGYSLDQSSLVEVLKSLRMESERNIQAEITITPAEVRRDNLAELGIVEKVSTGWSTFTGSPANRIHNIKTGASKFNQVLIKPGEKFSFNTTLGPVNAATGYLPELVILVNKTVPQYGGGLCQVSSTAFRAALNAGFPIIERRNHAYPVSYYRPYGVDATIYLPKPDLAFENDSGKYVLIQTRIEGKRLYFDFFGTKISRTVKFAGNKEASGAVEEVEKVSPAIYDQEKRGRGSFTAAVYRFKYDLTGKLIKMDTFVSRYDSPDKYPH